jgi:hypothetical protein
VPLVLLERTRWGWFNGIYLVRFGFGMWEILIFKWFLPLKNSNKFQETRFWKEKSVEDVATLGPTAQATLVYFTIYFLQLIIKVTHGSIVVVDQWWESQLVVDVTVADQWATINLLLMIVYGHPKALISRGGGLRNLHESGNDLVKGISFFMSQWGRCHPKLTLVAFLSSHWSCSKIPENLKSSLCWGEKLLFRGPGYIALGCGRWVLKSSKNLKGGWFLTPFLFLDSKSCSY